MVFERENPRCRFTIPERPTVRQQLEYYSLAGGLSVADMLMRYWNGAKALILEWQCEELPDYKADLDSITSAKAAEVVIWAGMQVRNYMVSLDELPKNL